MAHYNEYDEFDDHYQDIPLAVLEHFLPKATKSIKGSNAKHFWHEQKKNPNHLRRFFFISIPDQTAAATTSAETVYDNFPVPSTRNKSVQQKNGMASSQHQLVRNNLDIGSMVEVHRSLSLTLSLFPSLVLRVHSIPFRLISRFRCHVKILKTFTASFGGSVWYRARKFCRLALNWKTNRSIKQTTMV